MEYQIKNEIDINNETKSGIKNEHKRETTFHKLQNLQTLLKKESALKGLFSETEKNTQKDIEQLCKEIYHKRIDVLNVLKNEANVNNVIRYHLVENPKDYLKDLVLYIPKFLAYLWENPQLIAKLLIHSDVNDVRRFLAPLFCNNFYENILSPNHIEDQLLYVIYLLLEEEIDKLNDINNTSKFLNDTACGYLLNELMDKKDVKSFFKIILKDAIEIMELSNSDTNLFFEANRIEKDIVERKKSISKKNSTRKSNVIDMTIYDSQKQRTEDEKKKHEEFFSNYLIDLNIQKINELKEKYISENNDKMRAYIEYQLNSKEETETIDLYSNKKFFKLMNCNSPYTFEILMNYEKNFDIVINCINSIIDNILQNLDLLPYSIKCVCKIISSLLEKKFKNINIIEKNVFISKFFLNKIFIPILINPANGALINNYIISNNTLMNLNTISFILLQFTSFKFFNSKDNGTFSPFNLYFLNKVEKLFEIYDNLNLVKLPNFIGKLIKGEISKENYEYNYFNENNKELLFHRSIFLSVNHIKALLNNITKLKNIIFNEKNTFFQKIIAKLYDGRDNEKFLNSLCEENEVFTVIKLENKTKKKMEEKREKNIKYFLFTDILYNDKYKKLLSSLSKGKSFFKLEEKKISHNNKEDNKDNKEVIENLIIKTKNVISTILYNYRVFIETDFRDVENINTSDIFKKLKLFMKSTDFVVDESIPSEWYIELLFEYLKKLPHEYRENDYNKLYAELKNDIEKSIKQYDFEELSIMIDKKKFRRKIKAYYNNKKEILDDINLNKEVNSIIENEPINVKLYFRYNVDKKELNIYQEDKGDKQLDFLDSFIFVDGNHKAKPCKTIESFTKNFPDLDTIASIDNRSIFDIQRDLRVPDKLNSYFNIIKNYLKVGNKAKDEKSLNIIFEKIYDYVMSKIYRKIYPNEENTFDLSLQKKIEIYSWIEPNNLIKGNTNYNFELVLPDITRYFNSIDIEKSPRKKISNMVNIFSSINKLLIFHNQTLNEVDDQIPLLIYIFIKAKPKRIYNNIEFMELYMGENILKNEDNCLILFKAIRDFTFNLTPNSLHNISKKEFYGNYNVDFTATNNNALVGNFEDIDESNDDNKSIISTEEEKHSTEENNLFSFKTSNLI